MEAVFHDVPFAPGLKTVARRNLKGHHYSQILSATDLVLVDLSTTALRNLGIKRGELIETEKDIYPQTRKWAEAILAQCPDAQGLCWVSRHDDRSSAIVLFGDRAGKAPLSEHSTSVDIINDAATHADVITLAGRIGVKITVSRLHQAPTEAALSGYNTLFGACSQWLATVDPDRFLQLSSSYTLIHCSGDLNEVQLPLWAFILPNGGNWSA